MEHLPDLIMEQLHEALTQAQHAAWPWMSGDCGKTTARFLNPNPRVEAVLLHRQCARRFLGSDRPRKPVSADHNMPKIE